MAVLKNPFWKEGRIAPLTSATAALLDPRIVLENLMAQRYFATDITTSGPAITAASGDEIYILSGTDIRSTASDGIVLPTGPSGASIYIAGSVEGRINAIDLSHTLDNSVVIYAGGLVKSTLTGSTIYTYGSVVNHGTITSAASSTAILFKDSDSYLYNTGTINGGVQKEILFGPGYTSTSTATYFNEGTINGGVSGGVRADIYNSGIINGGAAGDLYVGTNGRITGGVLGSNADDVFLGGAFADRFDAGKGQNWLVGGGGADDITIDIDLAVDTIFAGKVNGFDNSLDDTIRIMPKETYSSPPYDGANIFLAGGYITKAASGQPLIAYIGTGFENAFGGSGNDALIGNAANNLLQGGWGGDWLVGGLGADTFRYASLQDVGAGEQIADFKRSEGDVIDLRGIDAKSMFGEDQAFTIVQEHIISPGEMVITNYAHGARVDLYVDNNATIDGTIFVSFGESGVTSLQATDFML